MHTSTTRSCSHLPGHLYPSELTQRWSNVQQRLACFCDSISMSSRLTCLLTYLTPCACCGVVCTESSRCLEELKAGCQSTLTLQLNLSHLLDSSSSKVSTSIVQIPPARKAPQFPLPAFPPLHTPDSLAPNVSLFILAGVEAEAKSIDLFASDQEPSSRGREQDLPILSLKSDLIVRALEHCK